MYYENSSVAIYNQHMGYEEQKYHAIQAENALQCVEKFRQFLNEVDKLPAQYQSKVSKLCSTMAFEYLREHGMMW